MVEPTKTQKKGKTLNVEKSFLMMVLGHVEKAVKDIKEIFSWKKDVNKRIDEIESIIRYSQKLNIIPPEVGAKPTVVRVPSVAKMEVMSKNVCTIFFAVSPETPDERIDQMGKQVRSEIEEIIARYKIKTLKIDLERK